jgi:hypothetical protein
MLVAKTASADLVFDGFATTTGLTLNGSANTAASSDGTVLRLTPATAWASGSTFSTARVSSAQFTSVFSFRITESGGGLISPNTSAGADGIVFVVQNVANNVGGAGGGLGYVGLTPSAAIEFDTFYNPENADLSQSHVAIDINGSVVHNAQNGPVVNIPSPELDATDRWWAWVLYNEGTMKVYLLQSETTAEPVRPAAPILDYPMDLAGILGEETAFAGFTSGTGANWANHDILYWRYTNVVPEPGSLLLALAGAGCLTGWTWRYRRHSHKDC